MKHSVTIVDAIGIHSGMRYYLDSFREILERIDSVEVSILSNYSDSNEKPFFLNFYEGNAISKLFRLTIGLLRLWTYSLTHNNRVFIILSYGTLVDALLIRATWTKNRVIDVHEVIKQGSENKRFHRFLFSSIFANQKKVIYHSERAKRLLEECGFHGDFFYVPHFEYNTDSDYDVRNISQTIQNSIKKDKINLLFFGNITYSKGIDLFIRSINDLKTEIKEKLNVIIAGKVLDDAFSNCDTTSEVFCVSIQHLNDDEMKFLYLQTDYVVLPYRQTSQSGVLEMAIHYQKPVVVSYIPYFSMMLNKYPSFGVITDLDQDSLRRTWVMVTDRNALLTYYQEDDIKKYKAREEDTFFVNAFSTYLQGLKDS